MAGGGGGKLNPLPWKRNVNRLAMPGNSVKRCYKVPVTGFLPEIFLKGEIQYNANSIVIQIFLFLSEKILGGKILGGNFLKVGEPREGERFCACVPVERGQCDWEKATIPCIIMRYANTYNITTHKFK